MYYYAGTVSSDDDTVVFCAPDVVCDSEQDDLHDEQAWRGRGSTRRPSTRDRLQRLRHPSPSSELGHSSRGPFLLVSYLHLLVAPRRRPRTLPSTSLSSLSIAKSAANRSFALARDRTSATGTVLSDIMQTLRAWPLIAADGSCGRSGCIYRSDVRGSAALCSRTDMLWEQTVAFDSVFSRANSLVRGNRHTAVSVWMFPLPHTRYEVSMYTAVGVLT